MAESEVVIYNMALSRIGVSQTVSSTDEATLAAETCSLFFAPMRDAVLRQADWGFATRRRALGLVEEDPNDDWAYSYSWPDNCIRPIAIVSTGGRLVDRTNPIPFEIGGDDNYRLIFTDQEDAILKYVARVTDVTRFDADFDSAFAWRLAQELATPLARNKGAMRDLAIKMYAYELSVARAAMANTQQADAEPDAGYVRDRA